MRFHRFAKGALVYMVLVILWGAVVRATGSGAGCGDHWPRCDGAIIPSLANVKMQIEFVHRLMSGVSLIWVAGLWVASKRVFAPYSSGRIWMNRAAVFLILEALVGAGLVLLKLTALDQSLLRVFSIAVHLVNTLLLLLSLTAVAMHKTSDSTVDWSPAFSKRTRWAYLGLFMALGITGAMTALGDTLFPVATIQEGVAQHWAQGAHVLVHLRIVHPILALGYLAFCFRDERLHRTWLAGLAVQCALGLVNILLLAPVWMQMVHLSMATSLWIGLCLQCLRIRQRPESIQLHPATEAVGTL